MLINKCVTFNYKSCLEFITKKLLQICLFIYLPTITTSLSGISLWQINTFNFENIKMLYINKY